MSHSRSNFGRSDNSDKVRVFVRDSENTLKMAPNDYTGNKHIGNGGYNFVALMHFNMLYERGEKYTNKLGTMLKAESEFYSVPKCFDECVSDVTAGFNSVEKNCMRECYFKRQSTRDDMVIYFQQKSAFEHLKSVRDRLV